MEGMKYKQDTLVVFKVALYEFLRTPMCANLSAARMLIVVDLQVQIEKLLSFQLCIKPSTKVVC